MLDFAKLCLALMLNAKEAQNYAKKHNYAKYGNLDGGGPVVSCVDPSQESNNTLGECYP